MCFSREQCVQWCVARHRYVPGDKVSLFLMDRELARVASSCHIALDMLCQEMREALQLD